MKAQGQQKDSRVGIPHVSCDILEKELGVVGSVNTVIAEHVCHGNISGILSFIFTTNKMFTAYPIYYES